MIVDKKKLSEIYRKCWDDVKNDPGYEGKTMPRLITFRNDLPSQALAAYCKIDHTVSVGFTFWSVYGNEDLDDKAVQEIHDILYHELAHVIHFDHKPDFWKQTHKHDSVGAQIRDHYQQDLDKFNQKIKEVQEKSGEFLTKQEQLERLQQRIAEAQQKEIT